MFNALRFVTLLLVALSMGMAFAHALEFGPKMTYNAQTYLLLHRTLYRWFGPPLGGLIEVGAVVASVAFAIVQWRSKAAARAATVAAACVVLAHAFWWVWVNPANVALAAMPLDAPPADWIEWRDQWEYTHFARFVLQVAGLAALMRSMLNESGATAASSSHRRAAA